jgi:hypothetical protein
VSVAIRIYRAGDTYIGSAGPPELPSLWSTDRAYPREELRWKIESMGAHPVDVADAFHAADRIREAVLNAFREHGVTGQVAVALSHDEAVFVLATRVAAGIVGCGLNTELQRLVDKKVWVTTESELWRGRTEPL